MGKFVSGLLVASALVGIVSCGGSSGGSDSGNSASNEETRSLVSGTGTWLHAAEATCNETWAFEDNDIAADAYQITSQVDSEALIDIGIGSFVFDTAVTSGERHSLVFTVTNIQNITTCASSPYDDNEPVNATESVTLYLSFSTDEQFAVYTSATDGVSLGTFDRVLP
ncbi:hypothetical protein A9Q81_04165 [Gammaproteobacteria bacterium 42_54_T18]|nr:hypothetical protein A9Q81_04165 [Gammaproteobacteria bacterium 42_54_T18]